MATIILIILGLIALKLILGIIAYLTGIIVPLLTLILVIVKAVIKAVCHVIRFTFITIRKAVTLSIRFVRWIKSRRNRSEVIIEVTSPVD